MDSQPSFDDIRLNFNPEAPAPRFVEKPIKRLLRAMIPRAAPAALSTALPDPVPWPSGLSPQAAPLDPPPAPSDSLERFEGYDAIVVTWTAAEAAALASLFVPGYKTTTWYLYRHNVESYIPLVTGSHAPFNDKGEGMERYYHTLGLYFPCTIGGARVLLFKSGLHLDYDGPQVPLFNLIQEIVKAVKPRMLITTGTGGGIGSDVALGDVIIGQAVRFDCTTQFRDQSWACSTLPTSPLPTGMLDAITPALTSVNAAKINGDYGARKVPKMWADAGTTIVTTDFFGFDESTNHYQLQGKGQACEMGDAMVVKAIAECGLDTRYYAIRNASDPQIANPDNNMVKAKQLAGKIYQQYGVFTTAASVVATWALIATAN